MDLAQLKEKFRHKMAANIGDIDIALKALPFLVREIDKLEIDLKNSKDRVAHLSSLLNKRPPKSLKGKKGQGEWEVRVDEDKNRLYITLAGFFDYQSAKVASNDITSTTVNLRDKADVVSDLRQLKGVEQRALFHIRKIAYTLDYVGVRRAIRIMSDDPAQAARISQIFPSETGYQVSMVNSIDDVEKLLDSSNKYLKA